MSRENFLQLPEQSHHCQLEDNLLQMRKEIKKTTQVMFYFSLSLSLFY